MKVTWNRPMHHLSSSCIAYRTWTTLSFACAETGISRNPILQQDVRINLQGFVTAGTAQMARLLPCHVLGFEPCCCSYMSNCLSFSYLPKNLFSRFCLFVHMHLEMSWWICVYDPFNIWCEWNKDRQELQSKWYLRSRCHIF